MGGGKRGIDISLQVHCLSARPDRQRYCYTNATSHSLLNDDRLLAQCRCLRSVRHHIVIPLATQMSVCVPPCAARPYVVCSVVAEVAGEPGAADPRLLDEARELGHQQHTGQENQDSQHKLNQPRGSFPENVDTPCLLTPCLNPPDIVQTWSALSWKGTQKMKQHMQTSRGPNVIA